MTPNEPPEAVVRRLLPEYLLARDHAARVRPGDTDFTAARADRDSLASRIAVALTSCADRTAVVPECGVRVAMDLATGDLFIFPLPVRQHATNLPGPGSRYGAAMESLSRVRKPTMISEEHS